MSRKRMVITSIVLCFMFSEISTAAIPNVVTGDIQTGIETYIEDQSNLGGGYFRLISGGTEYLFKLVRVHTEYLATLGPGRHFACVDLVNTDGDVYDVDFFLSGDPGNMTVTETTLHKLNGIPFYTWEQNAEGGWDKVPVEGARPELLGVIKGTDEFEFFYIAKLPIFTDVARMWIPLPQTDEFQTVEMTNIDSPKEYRVLDETKHGNKILYFELGPEDSEKTVDITYKVKRLEKSGYRSKTEDWQKSLEPDQLVPTNEKFQDIAEDIVAGKKGDLVRARALYDHVIDKIKYIKHGEGWGKGDAVYACDIGTGNCTDYHSYFISLARSVGIPARFAIGAAIPSGRNDAGVDGYHCWVEFYADGKWWPIDISEADKYTSLSTYYFGHHPANRLELSRGRDLVLDPGPKSGPINFLAYPVLEVDGSSVKIKPKFSFKRED
ncbi:MAG: transglutaminase-like domain-containing protein [Candidatus Aadella gelida]|nr:transglutaminase-like domain-containing protein [Candidatus Aadella gelida]